MKKLILTFAIVMTGCGTASYKNCSGTPNEAYCNKMYDAITPKQAMTLDSLKGFAKQSSEEGYAMDTICAEDKSPKASCVYACAKDENGKTWQDCAKTCRNIQVSEEMIEQYQKANYSQ